MGEVNIWSIHSCKNIKPDIKVVGVQPEGASSMYLSWKAKRIVEIESVNTVANGLDARKPLNYTFEIIRKYVDDIILVSDDEIGKAVVSLLFDTHILTELSAAASLATLLHHYQAKHKEKIALIISGGNISSSYLTTLLSKR